MGGSPSSGGGGSKEDVQGWISKLGSSPAPLDGSGLAAKNEAGGMGIPTPPPAGNTPLGDMPPAAPALPSDPGLQSGGMGSSPSPLPSPGMPDMGAMSGGMGGGMDGMMGGKPGGGNDFASLLQSLLQKSGGMGGWGGGAGA